MEFDANFGRMLRSDYNDQYIPISIVEGDITEDFADFIYSRYPGHAALRTWLNTLVDGASAEAAAGFWYNAWKRDRAGMVLAAARSKRRIHNVANALIGAIEDPAPEDEKVGADIGRVYQDLNRLRRSVNPKVAGAARA